MYFAAYWRFAECAEMDLFAELGFPYESVFESTISGCRACACEAEYHAPALMSDWLRLRTHVEHVGASSLRWRTVVFNERTGEAGAVFALYRCVHRSRSTKKSRPLPERSVRSALRRVGVVTAASASRRSSRRTDRVARRSGAARRRRAASSCGCARALTDGTDLKTYRRGHPKMPMPTRFGHEFSGDVAAVGDGVSAFAPGDAVMCVHTAPCGECFWCRRAEEELCES